MNAFLHSSIEEEVAANRLVPSSYFDSFQLLDGIRSNRERLVHVGLLPSDQ